MRTGQLIGSLLTEPGAAPEIRVHGVGPFLLHHFRSMSETAEEEQARLSQLAARIGRIAAAWTGLATLGTYATLGALLLSGAMEVFEKIRALASSGQTVVLITHRLASVRHADLVHVLEHGRLVESGAPEDADRRRCIRRVARPSGGTVRGEGTGAEADLNRRLAARPPHSAPSPTRTITRNMSVARSMTTSAGRPSRRRACANSSAGQDPRGPPAGKRSSTVRPFTISHLQKALYL
ncbi:hypothetical protein LK08_26765 [Streptomyces sp. MUSC 125]|nr:hypothetical protein LK08_26765 [Streptomyces sp. MUSC 125]